MKKKTLGILTFHKALNYGAVLQAYALKEVCDEMGYETHIIDYSFEKMEEDVAPWRHFFAAKSKKRALIKLLRELSCYFGDKKREKNFKAFREKYLAESVPCSSIREIEALNYDAYISGSDQIWNYQITGGDFDPAFFLQFSAGMNNVIYAASSQDTPFPLPMEEKLKTMLENTDAAIGIREKKLADYVAKLTGRRYQEVVDPTLLAGEMIMERIVQPTIRLKDYILLYQIDKNPASDITVSSLEKRFGCPVFTMTVPRLGSTHGRKGVAGPEEFLGLLKKANFIVTNSFHGVAISLIFRKQFYVYENGGVMNRINGLLGKVDLLDRKVKMVNDIDTGKLIDYSSIDRKLTFLRNESYLFLKSGLEGEKNWMPEEIHREPIIPLYMRKKEDCCGCTACAEVCPVNAILMERDEEGFLYPVVDGEKCIHCGRCDRVCGFHEAMKDQNTFDLPMAFGIRHKDISEFQSSRSGAAFVGFSDCILRRGGCVYGAVMLEDFSVSHMRAECSDQRNTMKKAKYVQSNLGDIFIQVEADLTHGKDVLFSGTPCQVAGIKAYLTEKKVDASKLICCDMICHGVPSPMIWQDYLKYIEELYGEKIKVANFRDKEFGWESHYESFVLESGRKIVSRDYTNLFYEHIMFRPSCEKCPFATVNRVGDLTMADFWGIEKQGHPEFLDDKGISLVLVNTRKGKDLFDEACQEFDWFQAELRNCIQPTLVKPSAASPLREAFWLDYPNLPFGEILKKYAIPAGKLARGKYYLKKCMYILRIRKHP